MWLAVLVGAAFAAPGVAAHGAPGERVLLVPSAPSERVRCVVHVDVDDTRTVAVPEGCPEPVAGPIRDSLEDWDWTPGRHVIGVAVDPAGLAGAKADVLAAEAPALLDTLDRPRLPKAKKASGDACTVLAAVGATGASGVVFAWDCDAALRDRVLDAVSTWRWSEGAAGSLRWATARVTAKNRMPKGGSDG